MLAPDGSGVEVPEALLPLSWLLGTWVGVGTGQYPTIEDFRFGQEVTFATDGRPFLTYFSRSWLLDEDGNRVKPLAMETGFWRPQPDNGVEVVLAHPSGFAEVWTGSIEVTSLENARITGARAYLRTTSVAATPSAKEVLAGERMYGLVNGRLPWAYDMQAMGQPMQNHLSALLNRVEVASSSAGEPGEHDD